MYPMYLAMWLQAAKTLAIDTNFVVIVLPYLAHCPIVLLNDLFVWKVSKRVIGRDGAKFAFMLLFFNRFQTQFIIRCFTNVIE
jgi:hypothetical protein